VVSLNDLIDIVMYSRVDSSLLVVTWFVKLFRLVLMNNIVLQGLEYVMNVVSNYKCTCKDVDYYRWNDLFKTKNKPVSNTEKEKE